MRVPVSVCLYPYVCGCVEAQSRNSKLFCFAFIVVMRAQRLDVQASGFVLEIQCVIFLGAG